MNTPTTRGGSLPKWGELGRDLLTARTTLAAGLALLVVQGLVELSGGSSANPEIYRSLGLSRAGLLDGRVWGLVSYPWLHGNWGHLAINVFALLAIGPRVERIGGGLLVLKLLGLGCVAGGLCFLLLGGGDGSTVLVGVSGGIFALVLWLTSVSPGSRLWPLSISGRNLGLGLLLASAGLTLLNPDLGLPWFGELGARIGGLASLGVSHACHLGGALAGLAAARWALRPRVSLAQLQRDRARREGG